MSTTKSPEVALTYSGSGPGSIFVIDFDIATRGAAIRFLSQCVHEQGPHRNHQHLPLTPTAPRHSRFPHEEELLFPPMTALQSTGYSVRHRKRLVKVNASVSTAIADTSGIEQPDDVPGGVDAQ
jgi:hypothetical protein